MMSRYIYVLVALALTLFSAQAAELPDKNGLDAGVLSKYGRLDPGRLIDTAKYHYANRNYDKALVCYSLVINAPQKQDDAGLMRLKIEALNTSAVIYYYWMSDYIKAYRLLADAHALCKALSVPYKETEFKIYANTGNIYYRLGEWNMAERNYLKAMELCADSLDIMRLHNNIASVKMRKGDLDGAATHIEESLEISRRNDNINIFSTLGTAGLIEQKRKRYDLALHYYETALDDARNNNLVEYEAQNLTNIGSLLLETGRFEQALPHIHASNTIAGDHGLDHVLLENYKLLSDAEYLRGRYKPSMEYLRKYNDLRDSLFSADKLANINQLQRIGEISAANRQIEQLAMYQLVKERTINYQKIILAIVLAVLVSVSGVLFFVFRQKSELNRAYRALVEKNLENLKLHDRGSYDHPVNGSYKDSGGELLDRILTVMNDTETICNPNFSIIMLALAVESNQTYVSQVINNSMGKKFRALLNEYRIREAQRLLSKSDAAKYTIESISLGLGYKSPNTFRAAFQEITGVSPGFYLKSLSEAL